MAFPKPSGTYLAVAVSGLFMALGLSLPADAHQKQTPQTKSKIPLDGAKIYAAQCAGCHGDKGQGGPGYSKALVGNLSATELATFIKKSMPPGPKKCPAPESEKVAEFMHQAFYSPIAQERNRPARVTLSRLTVKQYRNAIADLVGPYHQAVPNQPPAGLQAYYFKGRYFDNKQKAFERVDSTIDFNFADKGPTAEFDPHTFAIFWQGSILAPDSGEYEFVIKSDHACRLYINGDKPLIDAFVKSGNEKEFHGTVNLLGGRAYPIRLEFSKATQGVDDGKKSNKPAGQASISFCWRRPKQTLEVVPTRFLFTQGIAKTFVVTAPFPPDDRSIGYERGNTVSKAWDEATTSAALETASYISSNLQPLAGADENDPKRKEKLLGFCKQFVERAFRTPLTPELEKTYVTKQFDATPSLDTAVKRVAILTLLSPRFLYREAALDRKNPYAIASQLSFGLWDTSPDPTLTQAASSGALQTPEQISQQAQRMANDPRAWTKLREFLLFWLKVDEVPDIVKSTKSFPTFDGTTATDLRSSLELFLEKTAWSPESDYRQLLLNPDVYLNGHLAPIYGVNLPSNAPFQAVGLDTGKRSGVITQPYLLSRFAYLETSSPIHRGVMIVRSLLGRNMQPPPAAFAPLAPSLHPSLTTRERVTLQTKPEACNSCHGMINPIGFTLESFDALGKLRSQENGKAVDSTGSYQPRVGALAKFAGATELAKYIANSDEAHAAFVEKLFQNLVKQPVLAYGSKTLPNLQQSFANNQYSIRKLMVDIMVTTTTSTPKSGAN